MSVVRMENVSAGGCYLPVVRVESASVGGCYLPVAAGGRPGGHGKFHPSPRRAPANGPFFRRPRLPPLDKSPCRRPPVQEPALPDGGGRAFVRAPAAEPQSFNNKETDGRRAQPASRPF